jgi:hypothetical protein
VRETLAAFVPVAKHAVDILRGTVTDHGTAVTAIPPNRLTASPPALS